MRVKLNKTVKTLRAFTVCWLGSSPHGYKSLRILIWSPAVLLALPVGLSRIYLGVHYQSDAIAGFAAAIIWILTVILIDFSLKKRYIFFKNNSV